jgi:hypothetical protein
MQDQNQNTDYIQPSGAQPAPPLDTKLVNKWLPIIIAGAFLALVAVVMVIGLVFGNKEEETGELLMTPAFIIDQVETSLTIEYDTIKLTGDEAQIAESRASSSTKISIKSTDKAPNWRLSNDNFFTTYEGDGAASLLFGIGTDYDYNTTLEDIRKLARDEFDNSGLAPVDYSADKAMQEANKEGAIEWYVGNEIVCSLHSATIACGEMSKYEPEQTKYRPYYKALQAAQQSVDVAQMLKLPMVASEISIRDSQKSGFELASVKESGMISDGGTLLYYRQADGDWQYALWYHLDVTCAAFKPGGESYDLREIFAGQSCFNSYDEDPGVVGAL